MSKNANWRSVKRHHSYSIDEAARALGHSRGTIRRWIDNGLPALKDQKPFLILGGDLIDYLRERQRPKVRCAIGEFYCFRCREARRAALGMAEVVQSSNTSVNIRALCESCDAVMHKRVATTRLSEFLAHLDISFDQARRDIDPTLFGTHSLRRTKVALIYRKTGNLRAVQLLLGHTKIESTVRYLGIEVDDALEIAEQMDV